jgi:uncharacterized repeat protein (TIGR04042 family)
MPEMTFTVRWPDGAVVDCYSPSLVMHDHLTTGASYPVAEFVARSTEALDLAAERVRARFGFACTSALAQRDDIERMAYAQGAGEVTVLSMHPPLPASSERVS